MTGEQQRKTVTVKPSAGGKEQKAAVAPGETPREVLARAVGRQSDRMLLRKEEDGYLDQDAAMYGQVRDGEVVTAAANPKVGDH